MSKRWSKRRVIPFRQRGEDWRPPFGMAFTSSLISRDALPTLDEPYAQNPDYCNGSAAIFAGVPRT